LDKKASENMNIRLSRMQTVQHACIIDE